MTLTLTYRHDSDSREAKAGLDWRRARGLSFFLSRPKRKRSQRRGEQIEGNATASNRECGRSLKDEEEEEEEEHTLRAKFRILNGTCARYGDFPWVAEIQLREAPFISPHFS